MGTGTFLIQKHSKEVFAISVILHMPDIKNCRIIFLGTPLFAVAVLDKLVKEGCQVVGVVTAPDKPAGRGMQLSQSAVKKYAVEHGLHVMHPTKLKDPSFIEELKSLRADIQVVVAFRMLPESVWNMPTLGTINLHASLLPQYRGAAPINWAIINGEKETGITTFKLQHAIDTGDLLMKQSIAIGEKENAGSLHDRMMIAGAELVYTTLQGYCNGSIQPIAQHDLISEEQLKAAPKIHTRTCEIDWGMGAKKVFDLIRGLSPYPTAFTTLNGKSLKIFEADYILEQHQSQPGQFETDGKSYLRFSAQDGWVYIKELQLEGKKRMDVSSFLKGFRFQ
jgi:methionyl-tRNA formyltransferase